MLRAKWLKGLMIWLNKLKSFYSLHKIVMTSWYKRLEPRSIMGESMILEEALASRHFLDHLNHLVGKPVREREIKEIVVVELEKESEKRDRKLEDNRKKFEEERKRWREEQDRKLEKDSKKFEKDKKRWREEQDMKFEEERERLLQTMRESVHKQQGELERMTEEKVFEKCTHNVLEI
ncbi:protein MNN4 [Lathyrus oleraceus]|uniref:protein MNN4 n=1 Tax=Pisum sativum TaxID=3888 RepID=UPI0021CFC50B|nr:protein MNN4-like [Pisum sativum]